MCVSRQQRHLPRESSVGSNTFGSPTNSLSLSLPLSPRTGLSCTTNCKGLTFKGMDPVAQEEFHRTLLMASARGHTQRAAVQTRAREPHGDPEFADNLMTQWGYGCYSAP